MSQADPYASGSILQNLVGFDAYRSGHYGNNDKFFTYGCIKLSYLCGQHSN